MFDQQEVAALERTARSNDARPSFSRVVNQDFRGVASRAEAEMLRRPENLDAWYDELVTTMRSFDDQLAAQRKRSAEARLDAITHNTMRAFDEAEIKVLEWRSHIFTLRRHIEIRIREIRRLRRAQRYHPYAQAILEHQRRYPSDPERANALLWKTIECYE